MNRIEKAQAEHKAAKLTYHAVWLKGDIQAMSEAQPKMEAAWAALCAASREEAAIPEEGAYEAAVQHRKLALDDA